MQTINTKNMTDEQRELFVAGWENAGGYMGDAEGCTPWCAPWYYENEITIDTDSDNPEDWGAAYWGKMQDEVEANIEDEEEADYSDMRDAGYTASCDAPAYTY